MTPSTPTGVLRVNRFDYRHHRRSPFLQAVGRVISHYFDLGFPALSSLVRSNLIGVCCFGNSLRELRRRDIYLRAEAMPAHRRAPHRGRLELCLTTNIAHTIWASRNPAPPCWWAGARPAAAGCSRSP